eukprot:gene9867-2058_t
MAYQTKLVSPISNYTSSEGEVQFFALCPVACHYLSVVQPLNVVSTHVESTMPVNKKVLNKNMQQTRQYLYSRLIALHTHKQQFLQQDLQSDPVTFKQSESHRETDPSYNVSSQVDRNFRELRSMYRYFAIFSLHSTALYSDSSRDAVFEPVNKEVTSYLHPYIFITTPTGEAIPELHRFCQLDQNICVLVENIVPLVVTIKAVGKVCVIGKAYVVCRNARWDTQPLHPPPVNIPFDVRYNQVVCSHIIKKFHVPVSTEPGVPHSVPVAETWDDANVYSAFRQYKVTKITSMEDTHFKSICDFVYGEATRSWDIDLNSAKFELGFLWSSFIFGNRYSLLHTLPQSKSQAPGKLQQPLGYITHVDRPYQGKIKMNRPIALYLSAALFQHVAITTLTESRCSSLLEHYKFTLIVVVASDIENAPLIDQITKGISQASPNLDFRVLSFVGTFQRGKCLNYGIQMAKTHYPDPLLFLLDVDMVINHQVLLLCQGMARLSESVYFPIAFSKASVLRDRDGEWRIYGFGMACMHASDYDRVGGFSQDIHGWGLEDEDLFKKFLSDTSITVYRAPNHGLLHLWHEKLCDHTKLPAQQLLRCYKSLVQYDGDKFAIARKYGFFSFIGVNEDVLDGL